MGFGVTAAGSSRSMDGTDRHSRSSASASAHACAGVTGAALSSVPDSKDIVTTGESLFRSAVTGAGAAPGANLASNDKAVHSRVGSPRRVDRNCPPTSLRTRSMRTSCVSFLITGPRARQVRHVVCGCDGFVRPRHSGAERSGTQRARCLTLIRRSRAGRTGGSPGVQRFRGDCGGRRCHREAVS